MLKLLASILFITFFYYSVSSQEKPILNPISLKGELSKRYSFQFSSVVIKSDSIILVTEKCGKIYILNKTTFEEISVIDLPKNSVESIEGVTLYKDRYLLMLDENKPAVFCYDLKGQFPFRSIAGSEILGDINEEHLEGIAVNEKQSICYLLQEKASKIFLFDIKEDNSLSLRQGVKEILIPDKGWTRHTDLYFDRDSFYILSTNYDKKPLKYGVDIFPVSATGTSLVAGYRMIDLTSCLDLPNHNAYSQNLEGIGKDRQYFYVISDNDQSDNNCCTQTITCKLSLFFKFKRK